MNSQRVSIFFIIPPPVIRVIVRAYSLTPTIQPAMRSTRGPQRAKNADENAISKLKQQISSAAVNGTSRSTRNTNLAVVAKNGHQRPALGEVTTKAVNRKVRTISPILSTPVRSTAISLLSLGGALCYASGAGMEFQRDLCHGSACSSRLRVSSPSEGCRLLYARGSIPVVLTLCHQTWELYSLTIAQIVPLQASGLSCTMFARIADHVRS